MVGAKRKREDRLLVFILSLFMFIPSIYHIHAPLRYVCMSIHAMIIPWHSGNGVGTVELA